MRQVIAKNVNRMLIFVFSHGFRVSKNPLKLALWQKEYCEIMYFRGAQFSWICVKRHFVGAVISWIYDFFFTEIRIGP